MFIFIATFKKCIFIKATKVIQSRALSDFLFFFCFLIHINSILGSSRYYILHCFHFNTRII